jgi:hypothetical protein
MTDAVRTATAEHDSTFTTLEDLLAKEGTIRVAWGKHPAVVNHVELAQRLPTTAELLEFPLLRPPFLSVLRDWQNIQTERYCRPTKIVQSVGPELVVDRSQLQKELENGAAVKFNRMDLWHPGTSAIARRIGEVLDKEAKAWGFLSHCGQIMLPQHRDPGHNIAVQLAGSKRWHLGDPCPAGSWSPLDPVRPVEETTSVTLREGDVLYLPHGYAHCAESESEMSLHIAFALEGPTAGEIRKQATTLLAKRLDLRDGTELRTDNIADVLNNLSATFADIAAALARMASHDLSGADRHHLATLLEGQ